MKKTFAIALAAAVGIVGVSETIPAASAAEASPATLDQVRGDALARLAAGDIQTVDRRGRGGRGHWGRGGRGHWGGGGRRGWHGGGGRGWRGDRGYRYGRYGYGGRRYYYGRRHHGHGGAYLGAGIAGLALGAAIASQPRRSYRGNYWCAQRYRTYDPRSGTYIGSGGVRRYCP